MITKITQCIPHVTQRYPYTHRVECGPNLHEFELIQDWLTEHDIPCTCIQPACAVYLAEANLTAFLLRWA